MRALPLKPQHSNYTDSQWQAIHDSGTNLLISASAGSGKTTVLVERVIGKLMAGVNIDELLIVTFTEAAAREMRERIETRLHRAIVEEKDPTLRRHFTKQLTLLSMAQISTLHAFCLNVIRRYYYLIDLDPVFRLMTDETEIAMLQEEVWDELREACYEENRPEFFQLTENFSNDRNDNGLTEVIFKLYEFSRANVSPRGWIKQLPAMYKIDDLATSNLYQNQIKPAILTTLAGCALSYEQMIASASGEPALKKVAELAQTEYQMVEQISQFVTGNQLDEAYQLMHQLKFGRYPSLKKNEAEAVVAANDELKTLRKSAKARLTKLLETSFSQTPAEQIAMMQQAAPVVQELARVGQLFFEKYSARKAEKGVLDFNDLEHLTLAILSTGPITDKQPTEASVYYRQKFKEVLVDEYQDVNRLQEAIVYWTRRAQKSAGNFFMVGDVKQSIYSFRLADPTLFIEKYNQFAKNDGGELIVLAENFRSRSEVLDFTNLIFSQIMDPAVGQIVYDQKAALVNGFTAFPASPDFKPELLIYEKEQQSTDAIVDFVEDKTEGEVLMVALKIRELVSGNKPFLIYDKAQKAMRPLEYRDIVLLTPTRKNNLAILDIFKRLDIPLEVNDAQNYFQATEIQIMVSLLNILDNPYQDIPLAAVLRSPLVGLNEKELALVRLFAKDKSFYDAYVVAVQKATESLGDKLRTFHAQLLNWREMARRVPLAELIWQVYQDTGFLDYVLGMSAGAQRHANLLALIQRAQAYEDSSFRGLYQFVNFVSKMAEKNNDLSEPPTEPAENAVRVMTIHASKGLEFPVVFLLDMSKKPNLMELNSDYMFHEQLGVGIKYLASQTRVKSPTLAFNALHQIRLQKLLSEEMRKLYVALTRAEQKLYIVGSYKNQETMFKAWNKGASQPELVLPAALRLSQSSSLLDWIGLALFRHPTMAQYETETPVAKLDQLQTHPGNFILHWVSQRDLLQQQQALQPTQQSAKEPIVEDEKQTIEELVAQFNQEYTFPKATKTANYQSVSEIKRLFNDPDESASSKLVWESADEKAKTEFYRYTQSELTGPKFLAADQNITGAEIGTATHNVMQKIDLTEPVTAEAIEAIVTEMVKTQVITETLAQKIDQQAILQFFAHPLGQELQNHPLFVHREQPFAMLKQASEIFADYQAQEDEVLIHGIIDGYIEYPDQVVLYDFKTDFVLKEDQSKLAEIKNRYSGQLRMYQQALTLALHKPVTHAYLVLLSADLILDLNE